MKIIVQVAGVLKSFKDYKIQLFEIFRISYTEYYVSPFDKGHKNDTLPHHDQFYLLLTLR